MQTTPVSERPPVTLSPAQRQIIERQLQQLSPFAAHHSPRKPVQDRSSSRRPSALPSQASSCQLRTPAGLQNPVAATSAQAKSPTQLASPQARGLSQSEGQGREQATMAAAAAAMAVALSPHRPSSTHSSPCLSTRGEALL